MDNIVKCPKCNGNEKGCSYCAEIGYVFNEKGSYYTITIDQNDNPIKGKYIGSSATQTPQASTNDTETYTAPSGAFSKIFPEPEPHDMKWFFKKK